MEQKNTNVKVPLISKIAYGMGDVGCNFSWMFVGNFLMIFYTDVFGIGMSAVAGLMLFSNKKAYNKIVQEIQERKENGRHVFPPTGKREQISC